MRARGNGKKETETSEQWNQRKTKRKTEGENDKQGLFRMALSEYQTQSAVSNFMEKASFCKSKTCNVSKIHS